MSSTVAQLGPGEAAALRALLSRDPVGNLYLLGVHEEFGTVPKPGQPPFAFHGRFVRGELVAAVFVGGTGGLVIPSANDALDIGKIAESLVGKVRLRGAAGESALVDVLVRHLCPGRPTFSRNQRLFSVSADDLGPFTNPTLRLARDTDVERLVPLAAGAVEEVLGENPLAVDSAAFEARVRQRVQAKRTYVLEADGELVFKIDVGSRSQHGAELEGLYTSPDQRRKGHATLTLGQISRHLLSSLPRLTLRIDDSAETLAKVARKVGFVPGRAHKRVLMADGYITSPPSTSMVRPLK